ncbi:hypothetical protein [Clostridium arbusti]|uniref:hypothetical protein n=1 Tax=Clostridium arbusti TaxID=1137848 RepID=UPI0002896671|nr:hypothetical protein [Clostridium arbusti]
MKLSNIEKIKSKNLEMKEKVQEGRKPVIKITYKDPSMLLLHRLYRLKDFNKIRKVYEALPIITDIEVDRDIEWFQKQIERDNHAAIVILNDVLEEIKDTEDYCTRAIQTAREDEFYDDLLEFMYV